MEKRQVQNVDRISALPDAVVCHILSFLPTIDALMTTFLSPRWRNLWTHVSSVAIQDDDACNHVAFSRLVRRIFSFRGLSNIHKFSLQCGHFKRFSLISRWIDTAVRHKVVEIELSIHSHLSDSSTFELPHCLLMCKTLVVLNLRSDFIINSPTLSGCFPALKSLNVSVVFADKSSMQKLFSHLPVLEDLTITAFSALNQPTEDFKVIITAPKLKRLKIDLFGGLQCIIHINALNLEDLYLLGHIVSSFSLEKAQSLVRADLINRYLSQELSHVMALLERISKVKSLSLEAIGLEACFLPCFDNLKQLKLVLDYYYDWTLVIEFLKRSPNLELLDIVSTSIHSEELDLPDSVPLCLSSKLKTVSISRLCGRKNEMDVVKYLSQNGEVLNKMTIESTLDQDEKEELGEEFSMYQIASKTCKIELIDLKAHFRVF